MARIHAVAERSLVLDTHTSVLNSYHVAECRFLDAVPIFDPYPWEQAMGKGLEIFPTGFR